MTEDYLPIAARIEAAVAEVRPTDRLDEIVDPTAGRTARSRRRVMAVVAIAASITVFAALAAIQQHDPQTVRTGTSDSTTTSRCNMAIPPSQEPRAIAVPSGESATPTTTVTMEDFMGVPEGHRVLVGNDDPEEDLTGYVNWDVMVPFVGGQPNEPPDIAPIYDHGGPSSTDGNVIGYWGHNLGWLTPEQALDPLFDYDEAVAAKRASDLAVLTRICGGSESPPPDPAEPPG